MRKIQARIKTLFGEIIVEGENAQEIIETLDSLPPQFSGRESQAVNRIAVV